jgi:hypothetical protein
MLSIDQLIDGVGPETDRIFCFHCIGARCFAIYILIRTLKCGIDQLINISVLPTTTLITDNTSHRLVLVLRISQLVEQELLLGLSIPHKEGALPAKLVFSRVKEVRHEYYYFYLSLHAELLVTKYLLRVYRSIWSTPCML